jgi:phosphoglucomutase
LTPPSTKLISFAVTQAICLYRQQQGIDGSLFLGIDTHALSESLYAESFTGPDHLHRIQEETQAVIQRAFDDGGAK